MQEAISYSSTAQDFSYKAGMDQVRELISQQAKAEGLSLKAISLKLGKSHSYLQQFIKRGVPAELPEDIRPHLAEMLKVEQQELMSPAKAARLSMTTAGAPASESPRNARVGAPIVIGAKIPVFGQAVGGKDGQFILNGNRIADILAPPALANVPNAYAVYVVGSSMEPRYFAGEAVFVNPRLPVRKGDFVVVQIAEEEGAAPSAYIKRYIGKDGRSLRLEQFSPRKTLSMPAARVVSVHRIIMGGDG